MPCSAVGLLQVCLSASQRDSSQLSCLCPSQSQPLVLLTMNHRYLKDSFYIYAAFILQAPPCLHPRGWCLSAPCPSSGHRSPLLPTRVWPTEPTELASVFLPCPEFLRPCTLCLGGAGHSQHSCPCALQAGACCLVKHSQVLEGFLLQRSLAHHSSRPL